MRLSIVVPAYKVENYIEKCIRSLEEQDISKGDYEIIVTNDGSPDGCRQIVEQLQKEFPNIILINQKNKGVSMARNNAMDVAKGKYIMPIDPDDYVLPNTFSEVLATAESKELDVLHLGFEIFDTDGNSFWQTNYSKLQGQIYDGVEGYFHSHEPSTRDPDRSVAILYRREMLRQYKINYPKDVPFLEDGLFIGKVCAVAEKVGFDNRKFYQRTTRLGSATNSRLFYSDDAIEGFIIAIRDLKSFAVDNLLNKSQDLLINHVVAKFTLLPVTSVISQKKPFKYIRLIKKLKENGIKKIEMNGLRTVFIPLSKMYNFSPLFFFIYYPFYVKYIKKYKY